MTVPSRLTGSVSLPVFLKGNENMINAFVNTPVLVEPDAIIPFAGSRAVTRASCLCNGGWLYHAEGSGQFQLTKPGIYRVDFSAQITAAAAGDVTFTLNANGEALAGTEMGTTLDAAGLDQISTTALIVVPCGASINVTVENTSATEVTVNAASFVITRVC